MTDNPAADAYWTEYERLWNQTVGALTAAVRLNHPEHGQADFASFLSSAPRATVANVGSIDTRPLEVRHRPRQRSQPPHTEAALHYRGRLARLRQRGPRR